MNRSLAMLLALPLATAAAFAQTPVRVACVGDSITYGDKLDDRENQCYPAVLARLANGRLAVGNFGVNGATALATPFRTWTDTLACRAALEFKPDVAVILLGINDFLGFYDQIDGYPGALRGVVGRFQTLPSAPRLFLCTLIPLAPEAQAADANRRIRDTMNTAIRAVAAKTGATVIDLAAVFPAQLEWLPDGLHPSPAGAELIARTVLAALDAPAAPRIQAAPVAGPVDLSIRNEAFAARARAEQWLKTQPAATNLLDPRDAPAAADLLPLLSESGAGGGTNLFYSYAALAAALARAGQETVFLAADRPVAWRAALLHRLVRLQRIDARGGGYWTDPEADGNAVPSTAYALQALAAALGD